MVSHLAWFVLRRSKVPKGSRASQAVPVTTDAFVTGRSNVLASATHPLADPLAGLAVRPWATALER